jgi:prepilin-type N-terminal cleavage/methylation domain-containing protein
VRYTNNNLGRGFTLVEILIAITVFTTLIIISSSLFVQSYVSGRPTSIAKNKLNNDLLLVSKTLRQKMNNASAKATFHSGFGSSTTVHGFSLNSGEPDNPSLLTIVSRDQQNPTKPICTFFIFDKSLWMKEETCSSFPTDLNDHTDYQKLTSTDTNLTTYELKQINPMELKLTNFTLVDNKDNKATFQDTYNIGYETYEAIK